MATKSYTDLEQSRKLAEILPLESADMWYEDSGLMIPHLGHIPKEHTDTEISCWSLAALLDYLKNKDKFPEIKELSDGRFQLTNFIGNGKDCIEVTIEDTMVDACCEMILKLYELKML